VRTVLGAALLLLTLSAAADDPPLRTQDPGLRTSETVVVTQQPTPLGDTAEDVAVVTREALDVSASPAVDDALRQVPGFALFRRTGSRAANPTSQGVSLRGIGASGASRALVLDDGIPLNDPFGGWIYWGRIPEAALQRVEVLRGGASELWGSGAMGGVIELVRRDDDGVRADVSAGSDATRAGSLFSGVRRGDWSAQLAADLFATDGYTLVDESQRGIVDVEANARHTALDLSVRHAGVFVRASRYAEARENGTPLQTNDTALRQLAAGFDGLGALPLSARAYWSGQRYHQTFSAIAANRNSERLTIDQRVPSNARGASLRLVPRSFILGAEVREVRGASEEIAFAPSGATTPSRAGGRQRAVSLYAADVITRNRLTLTAALRYDGWRNFDAAQNGIALASRSDSAWSPRVSALVALSPRVSLTASAYSAFRAPTLNELYRGFRVGNVLTLPNDSLGPERLTGYEAGARAGGLRVTLFAMRTGDTIANVTTSVTQALITRRRQNFGSSRSRGAEVEYTVTKKAWSLTTGCLLADATLSTGTRTPQVPRQQATLQLIHRGSITAGAAARWSSMQFDDDLNEFRLNSAFVTDLFASRALARGLEATIAVENLFNERIEAAATPVVTLGQPRGVRIGLRYMLGR
jgi:outer membrane receptor protein involved in Fe transport